MDFGNRIKELRVASHLTQTQLANRLGVSKSTICYYENEDRYPSHDILVKIARLFHVTTDYLLGVDRGFSIDVSDLTNSQRKVLELTAEEFRKTNKKSG